MYDVENEITKNFDFVHELLSKDFRRLEKLLAFDLPETKVAFDYTTLDESTRSIIIAIPDQLETISNYLAANFYSFIKVGGLSDPLIRTNGLARVFQPNMIFSHQQRSVKFKEFGKKYRGYLDETPGRPGLHHDFSITKCVTLEGAEITINTVDIDMQTNTTLVAKIEALSPEWKYEGIEDISYIGSLPPTKFFEGDVVFVKNAQTNAVSTEQSLVFRIDWAKNPIEYRVKMANSNNIECLTEDRLEICAHGVTRLFYTGKPPVHWKNLKSEAEYYLLLGLFNYHYNPINDSYQWSIGQAKRVIKEGGAHGVLSWQGKNFLISYTLDENTTFEPEEVADAFLMSDLILTL